MQPDIHDALAATYNSPRVALFVVIALIAGGTAFLLGRSLITALVDRRVSAQQATLAAERKYRGIFDEAIIGIFQMSPDGSLLSANPALAGMFGYATPDAMLASLPMGWDALIDPANLDAAKASLEKVGRAQHLERDVVRKDGTRICIASNIHSISENGVLLRYDGMTHDITERKALRSQLLQAQKLESVGQLAAGIAHEINTPMQYVGDNVRFLKDAFVDLTKLLADFEHLRAAADSPTATLEQIHAATAAIKRTDAAYLLEEIPSAIAQTQEGVQRVSTLVSAMKEFSHPGTGEKEPSDLNRAIQGTVTVARSEWKHVAELVLDLDLSLPMISCHTSEFNQVILNLIVNAAHAIGDTLGEEDGDKGEIHVQTRDCPGCVEILIRDSGGGIPEEIRSRIFDPFFTTKEVGRGTGQGLAIARSVIVDKHSGTIDLETGLGKGTTFVIRLPHDGESLVSCPTA